jgi:predicted patatin/cPLA2 family phospholipase
MERAPADDADRAAADQTAHEVVRVLRERLRNGSTPGHRTDGLRVVLAVEGGGMRGTVSAGMALALHELGLVPAFDAVYGASAGAITGAWLLSSRPEGLRGWAEPSYAKALIRWRALLRGQPVVDVRTLVEEVYQTQFPMDFAAVLASAVEYHPLATDAATGASTDLRPLIGDPAELRLALRASASLPFLAGPPVRLRGRRFYDAGVAESIPFRTPLAQGATHVLVLRSRRPLADALAKTAAIPATNGAPHEATPAGAATPATGRAPHEAAAPAGVPPGRVAGTRPPRPPRSIRLLARTTLRGESPELRAALLTRGVRTAADIALIAELEAAGRALSVCPPASVPPVSRLTTDGALLAAALESGRAAVHAIFGD